MAKVVTTRWITAEGLRRLCIKNNWYTKGTNKDYEYLLTQLVWNFNHAPNKGEQDNCLVDIAFDIVNHSNTGGCAEDDEERVINVLYHMLNGGVIQTDIRFEKEV